MNDADHRGLWLRNYRAAPDAPVRLICFPHAGGSASYFIPLAQALSPSVDVWAVQYPGRQDRRNEPNLTDLHALASHVFAALDSLTNRPIALFGHSMGASVAFEVCRLLEFDAGIAPEHLFVSGRRAPSRRRTDLAHKLDDEALLADVRKLNGTDPRIFNDDELLRMALPAIRADYQAAETYSPMPGPVSSCPITVLTGADDPRTTLAEAEAWTHHTTSPCDVLVYPGGHFFLADQLPEITGLLIDRLLGHDRVDP